MKYKNEKSRLTTVIKILHEDNTCSQHVNHADTTNLKIWVKNIRFLVRVISERKSLLEILLTINPR